MPLSRAMDEARHFVFITLSPGADPSGGNVRVGRFPRDSFSGVTRPGPTPSRMIADLANGSAIVICGQQSELEAIDTWIKTGR